MSALQEANMPVSCAPNEYGLAHRDNPLFVAWMQQDEPDNAQKFDSFWQGDKERIKEGWPALYDSLKLATQPYRGYGPPVPPAWIVREYQRITAADPTRPVFLGLGQGVAWPKWHGRGERTGKLEDYPEYIKGCDIVCYDIYPKAEGAAELATALWHVPLGVRRLRQWCQDTKPVWVHIETGIINHPGSRPTPADVRAEVWMALIHGARGIDYFVHQFKPTFNEHALLDDASMLAAVTALNQQLTRLARVLNSPTIADGVTITATPATAPVHALVKRHGGATYVFAAAMTQQPAKPTFTLAGLPAGTTVEVLDEGRTLPFHDGAFTDDFAGHAVHLYRLAAP
jgi:hypothetical protein